MLVESGLKGTSGTNQGTSDYDQLQCFVFDEQERNCKLSLQ